MKSTPEYVHSLDLRIHALEKQNSMRADEINQAYQRLASLETIRNKQAFDAHTALKSQATQMQAESPYKPFPVVENLYAPLRSNAGPLLKLAAFARRLLDPDDLGHAVTPEVRDLAREALGK